MSSGTRGELRVLACSSARDARALVAELLANLGDASVTELALTHLSKLVIRDKVVVGAAALHTGALAAVLETLRAHRADAHMTQHVFFTLKNIFLNADGATLSQAAASAAEAVYASARFHRADADVLAAALEVIEILCLDDLVAQAVVGAVPDAVDAVCSVLRAHLSNARLAAGALSALGALFNDPAEVMRAVSAGCVVEIMMAAMRAHPSCDKVHGCACGALACMCLQYGVFDHVIMGDAVCAVLASMRRFADSEDVQSRGMSVVGCYLDDGGDDFDEDAARAALVALRRHGQSVSVLTTTFLVLCSLSGDEQPSSSASWMLATLGTPEAVTLLKNALARLVRAGEGTPEQAVLVRRMTHGACAGCGELQETKMKRCARCERAPYCSAACQRSHWPVHKLECKRPNAKAEGSGSAA